MPHLLEHALELWSRFLFNAAAYPIKSKCSQSSFLPLCAANFASYLGVPDLSHGYMINLSVKNSFQGNPP